MLGIREYFLCHIPDPRGPVTDDNGFFVFAVSVFHGA
jgi:hypothetical protein